MAKLKNKVTNALNEARILILGAQILLGFQLHAAFRPGFERVANHARWLDFLAFALMSVAVALLISPAPFHRLAEGGRDTRRVLGFASTMAESALVPIGLSVGIDMFIVAETVTSLKLSIVAAAILIGVAAFFWYGLEAVQCYRRREPPVEQEQQETELRTSISEKITTLLTEARVILPGAQALLGFQFVAFFSNEFEKLPDTAKLLHLASLACVALSTILLMAPAAYHRLAAKGEDLPDVDRIGSRMVIGALLPLALGLSGEFYIIVQRINGSQTLGWISVLSALTMFLCLWFVYPLLSGAAWQRRGLR